MQAEQLVESVAGNLSIVVGLEEARMSVRKFTRFIPLAVADTYYMDTGLVAAVEDTGQSAELGMAPSQELDPPDLVGRVVEEQSIEDFVRVVANLVVALLEQEVLATVADVQQGRAVDTAAVAPGIGADWEGTLSTLVVERLVRMFALLGDTECPEDTGNPLEVRSRDTFGAAGVGVDIDLDRLGFLRLDSTVTLLNCFEQRYSLLSFELNSDIASFEARLGMRSVKFGGDGWVVGQCDGGTQKDARD
jgi:hypothetical protein